MATPSHRKKARQAQQSQIGPQVNENFRLVIGIIAPAEAGGDGPAANSSVAPDAGIGLDPVPPQYFGFDGAT